jgi:hypothetical protein
MLMSMKTSQAEALKLGEKKYKTGKPCKYGHVSERWTLTANCCQCGIERINARRESFRLAGQKAG